MRFQSLRALQHQCLGVAVAGLCAAMITGCGGDDSSNGSSSSSSSSTSASSGGQGGSAGQGGGSGGSSASGGGAGGAGGGSGAACTEMNSLCINFKIPNDLKGTPTKLFVSLYKTLPAAGPPDFIGPTTNSPKVNPGDFYPVTVKNVTVKGAYEVFAVLYMPGGGPFQPKAGVDYDVASMPLMFTGAPVDAGTLEFKLHTATDGHVQQ